MIKNECMAQIVATRIAKSAIEMEVFAVSMYTYLAKKYPSLADSFLEFAGKESNHLIFWSNFLKKRKIDPHIRKPSQLKTATYQIAIHLLGRGLTLRLMERREASSIELYAGILSDTGVDEAERRDIQSILEDELVHEEEFIKEQSKRGGFMKYIKDAILGLNDGLVETLGVTTGLAGVYGSPYAVALGSLVVGVAGALSMGISIYTSSRSQQQVHEGILNRIASISRYVAVVIKDRVKQYALNKGYSQDVASSIAEETTSKPGMLSDFIAEEEYGLSAEGLAEPSKAAMYAGFSNLLGALIPLAPYFFVSDITSALILSLTFATIFLSVTGFLVSLLANMPARVKVFEMVVSGLGSAAITYVIGWGASILMGSKIA
jgi:VIT1/CCC1 family predicted Fe2+/Mn2+ transporter